MKKAIIATTLKFIPKAFQYKALCKALNYIIVGHDISLLTGQVIKLTITDLKVSWYVIYHEKHFSLSKNQHVNLEIQTDLKTVTNFQRKNVIVDAIKHNGIQFLGEPQLVDVMQAFLYQINENRLASLSSHLFSFLKLKSSQPIRLDINNVQLSDLKSALDIDFIRDQAVLLEKTDLNKALSLMELAHKARPDGPFITQKVIAYKKALNAVQ